MEELFKNAENVGRTIQLILAPALMISACAILVGGLLSRFAAINDRLRIMTRERLDLLRNISGNPFANERIRELDAQFPDLKRRLMLAHNAVMTIYGAILVFILDMLLIAVAALTNTIWTAFLSLLVFLTGISILGLVVLLTLREVRTSLYSILYEVEHVSILPPESDKIA